MLKFVRSLSVAGLLCLLCLPMIAAATGAAPDTNKSVSQGYASNGAVQNGMLVRLDAKNTEQVDPLTSDKATKILGVAVPASDAAITLSSDANTSQVFVAAFGRYDVLVSTQNGPIKAGDYITISALAGIGMKADNIQPIVVGQAAASFDGTGGVGSTSKLKTAGGGSINITIGRIPVDIAIAHNPLQKNIQVGLPGFLSAASQQIAGKQVGSTRVYICLVILLAATLLAGSMLYSGVRSGIVAIGRNPMAKKLIVGSITRVALTAMIIFLISLFGVYLILRL